MPGAVGDKNLTTGNETSAHRLGPDFFAGERPQFVVPAHCWQSAMSLGAWTLIGCSVAPGFKFSSFELAPPGWPRIRATRARAGNNKGNEEGALLSPLRRKHFDPLLQLIELAFHFLNIAGGILFAKSFRPFVHGFTGRYSGCRLERISERVEHREGLLE